MLQGCAMIHPYYGHSNRPHKTMEQLHYSIQTQHLVAASVSLYYRITLLCGDPVIPIHLRTKLNEMPARLPLLPRFRLSYRAFFLAFEKKWIAKGFLPYEQAAKT